MFIIAGVFFILAGIWMLIRFFIAMKRPKVEASILAVTKEYPEAAQNANVPLMRKFPHAQIQYWHEGVQIEQKIILKSKSKVGSTIHITFNPKKLNKAEQYYPNKELLAIATVMAVGAALIVYSVMLIDILER